jgi:hypothetical protein
MEPPPDVHAKEVNGVAGVSSQDRPALYTRLDADAVRSARR